MNLHINISGLAELRAIATPDLVIGPAQQAVAAVGEELGTPKGAGLGVQVNSLGVSIESMEATITTTTVWPRTSGNAWFGHTVDDFEPAAVSALEVVDAAITQAWG